MECRCWWFVACRILERVHSTSIVPRGTICSKLLDGNRLQVLLICCM